MNPLSFTQNRRTHPGALHLSASSTTTVLTVDRPSHFRGTWCLGACSTTQLRRGLQRFFSTIEFA